MRQIKLEPVLEFGGRADFAIIDITDGPEKKRGTITVDYAPADIKDLQNQGMDLDGALAYYEDRIYKLVRYYISGDWEYAGGREEALQLVRRHVAPFF